MDPAETNARQAGWLAGWLAGLLAGWLAEAGWQRFDGLLKTLRRSSGNIHLEPFSDSEHPWTHLLCLRVGLAVTLGRVFTTQRDA